MKSTFSASSFVASALLCGVALSSPTRVVETRDSTLVDRNPVPAPVASGQTLPDSLQSQLNAAVASIVAGGVSGDRVVKAYQSAVANLSSTEAQSKYEPVVSVIESAFSQATPGPIAPTSPKPRNIDEEEWAKRQTTGIDSSSNVNTRQPSTVIYPKKGSSDAAYSTAESALRSAIYIPSTFQYGAGSKQPVILIPGTAVPAGTNYQSNLIPLLTASSFGDPVWVNIPRYTLGDAQVSAEYVAYAINYINGITNKKVAVVTFSQGSIDTQWALKYWPSTRTNVTDFVAYSPDYHGTVEAYVLCPLLEVLGCTPSVYQQTYGSKFISTLRSKGGDSAYVPTTTIYSSTDEIVQPQSGVGASAYILDARSVGASNSQVQTVCPGKPAGGLVLHEGMLYNSLAWGLLQDALTHDGPGQTSRLNLNTVCAQPFAPGLSVDSVAKTEATNINAVVNVLAYAPKAFAEPAIKAYAV